MLPKGEQGEKGEAGEAGPAGADGKNGADGDDGLSAYQIWLQQGHSGSEDDFLNWLRGQGDRYAFTSSGIGSDGKLVISTTGCPVSISDNSGITYPLQFGSYIMSGTQVSIDMDTNLSAIGKSVSGTWHVNFASGGTGTNTATLRSVSQGTNITQLSSTWF